MCSFVRSPPVSCRPQPNRVPGPLQALSLPPLNSATHCRHVQLFYHQQAMTWGWYMLEPWETMLWMCILALLTYFVLGRGLSSCVIDSHSMCRSSLAAVRDAVAAGGEWISKSAVDAGASDAGAVQARMRR